MRRMRAILYWAGAQGLALDFFFFLAGPHGLLGPQGLADLLALALPAGAEAWAIAAGAGATKAVATIKALSFEVKLAAERGFIEHSI